MAEELIFFFFFLSEAKIIYIRAILDCNGCRFRPRVSASIKPSGRLIVCSSAAFRSASSPPRCGELSDSSFEGPEVADGVITPINKRRFRPGVDSTGAIPPPIDNHLRMRRSDRNKGDVLTGPGGARRAPVGGGAGPPPPIPRQAAHRGIRGPRDTHSEHCPNGHSIGGHHPYLVCSSQLLRPN